MRVDVVLSVAVLAPLMAALPAVIWPRRGPNIALAGVVAAAMALVAVWQAVWQGSVTTSLGGWSAPLGIVWTVDGVGAALLTLILLVMAVVLLFARLEFSSAPARQADSFWPLVLLLWAGLNVVVVTDDLFNAYVGLELTSLAAVGLVALTGKSDALAASLRYLGYALLGSLWYLLGTALLYGQHATLDIGLLAQADWQQPLDALALALITLGLLIKTALFPFHAWLPAAHAGAPASASAVLSALVPKAAFLLLLKIWFEAGVALASPPALTGLALLGTLAIVHGSLLAFRQSRLKLLIAWSTVAQIGYLFLVFPLAGGTAAAQPWAAGAWSGTWFQLLSHGLAKASMFLCAGLWLRAVGHDRLEGLRGLAGAMPITVLAFGLAAISLMGLPPTGGFTAKYLLLVAAFASGQWWWALVIVAGGLLSALYLYRPMALAMSRQGNETLRPVAMRWQWLPLLLALAAVALGLASGLPFEALQIGRPTASTEGL